jgi:peptidoglycan/xylan/chitin deacetylase (PgdA/CDA1 family)
MASNSRNKETAKIALKKKIGRMASCFSSVCGTDTKNGFRVLMYHSVTSEVAAFDSYQMTVPKGMFLWQMGFLHSSGYNVISCETAADMLARKEKIPPKTVLITFDDGYRDNLTNALPILKKYNFNATIFLTTGRIEKGKGFLGWEDLKFLLPDKTFSFGCHTSSHKKLGGADRETLEAEILLPKKMLEDKLGAAVNIFAYPFGCYGTFDDNTISFVGSAGYKAAFTTIAGFNDGNANAFRLKRTRISWFDDKYEFPRAMRGAYDWYRLWQRVSGSS